MSVVIVFCTILTSPFVNLYCVSAISLINEKLTSIASVVVLIPTHSGQHPQSSSHASALISLMKCLIMF